MYELINGNYMAIKEYNSQRVVTFKDIDTVHGRPEGTTRRNFNQNKQRFIEGVDFFVIDLTADEIRTQFGAGKNAGRTITVVTESGYLMLVKSFTDDLSWTVQRELVNIYFKTRTEQPPSKQALISWLFDYYGTNDKRKIKKRIKKRDNSGKIRKDEYYRLTLTPKAKRELGII